MSNFLDNINSTLNTTHDSSLINNSSDSNLNQGVDTNNATYLINNITDAITNNTTDLMNNITNLVTNNTTENIISNITNVDTSSITPSLNTYDNLWVIFGIVGGTISLLALIVVFIIYQRHKRKENVFNKLYRLAEKSSVPAEESQKQIKQFLTKYVNNVKFGKSETKKSTAETDSASSANSGEVKYVNKENENQNYSSSKNESKEENIINLKQIQIEEEDLGIEFKRHSKNSIKSDKINNSQESNKEEKTNFGKTKSSELEVVALFSEQLKNVNHAKKQKSILEEIERMKKKKKKEKKKLKSEIIINGENLTYAQEESSQRSSNHMLTNSHMSQVSAKSLIKKQNNSHISCYTDENREELDDFFFMKNENDNYDTIEDNLIILNEESKTKEPVIKEKVETNKITKFNTLDESKVDYTSLYQLKEDPDVILDNINTLRVKEHAIMTDFSPPLNFEIIKNGSVMTTEN